MQIPYHDAVGGLRWHSGGGHCSCRAVMPQIRAVQNAVERGSYKQAYNGLRCSAFPCPSTHRVLCLTEDQRCWRAVAILLVHEEAWKCSFSPPG